MSSPDKLQKGALYYASIGWKVLPCHGLLESGMCTCGGRHDDPKDIGKHPASQNGQTDATSDLVQIESWWRTNPVFNAGVLCRASGFFVLDIDPRHGGLESFARFESLMEGEIPDTVTALTGLYTPRGGTPVRGRHMYFAVEDGESIVGKLDGLPGIDIKYNGYVLLAPSRHVSGVEYEWAPGHAPWEMSISAPSEKMMEVLRKRAPRGKSSGGWDFINDLDWGGEKIDLEAFLEEGIHEGGRAVGMYRLACAMANRYPRLDGLERNAIETVLTKFNFEKVSPPLEMDELLRQIHAGIDFVAANPKARLSQKQAGMVQQYLGNVIGAPAKAVAAPQGQPVTLSVVQEPKAFEDWNHQPLANTSDPDDAHASALNGSSEWDLPVGMMLDSDAVNEEDGGQAGNRTLTDTGNGRRLVDHFGRALGYTPGMGWFSWTGQYWKPDLEGLDTQELSKRLAAVIAGEANQKDDADEQKAVFSWAKQVKSNARQKAAIESAQSDPRVVVPVDHWDNNPHLLGVANGVIDLRTGKLLTGRPDLHITKRAPVAYSPSFTSTRFQQFLDYATGGDKEFQEWLQRAFGYTLTGLSTYDVLFLMYGPPGSGKNVIVESLVKLLGTKQYAFPMDSTILSGDDSKPNSTDMYHWAELRGRRMVWFDELPESGRIKENAIKKITGSSEISARSPGEKPFTFEAQAKAWITTNHRPVILDDAMWRRLRPIPWVRPPVDPDPTLKAYLHDPEGGLPAVLSWAVEGAIKLLNSTEPDALGWCTVVSEAAEMYRKSEDRIGAFLEEEMEVSAAGQYALRSVYSIYQAWSNARNEKPLGLKKFVDRLTDRGITVAGSGSAAVVVGFTVKLAPMQQSNDWATMQALARF